MPTVSATELASLRSSSTVHSLSSAKSTQFFMNRPSTCSNCCFNNNAATEESTPPESPTTTLFTLLIFSYVKYPKDSGDRQYSLGNNRLQVYYADPLVCGVPLQKVTRGPGGYHHPAVGQDHDPTLFLKNSNEYRFRPYAGESSDIFRPVIADETSRQSLPLSHESLRR